MEKNKFVPWRWTKDISLKKKIIKPPSSDKLLTIITYDNRIRETRWLKMAYDCLAAQDAINNVDVIHIEWTKSPNSIIENYKFATIYTMNQTRCHDYFPSQDLGLEWNMGLFLSQTPWVCFFHCDIIHPKQIGRIIQKIKTTQNIYYFEGFEINGRAKHLNGGMQDFEESLDNAKQEWMNLPNTYNGKFLTPSHSNGVLCTFNKKYLIYSYDGFFWNIPEYSERWNGLSRPIYNGKGLRELLIEDNVALVSQEDMKVFGIPHERRGPEDRRRFSFEEIQPKFYSDFITNWIYKNPPTLYSSKSF